jgi:hypothetical protein
VFFSRDGHDFTQRRTTTARTATFKVPKWTLLFRRTSDTHQSPRFPPCFDADRTRASLITKNTIEDSTALAVWQFFDVGEAPVSDGWRITSAPSALVCNTVLALRFACRVSDATPVSDSLWVVDQQRYRTIRDSKLENLRCVFSILP